jgi:hypothetical protein
MIAEVYTCLYAHHRSPLLGNTLTAPLIPFATIMVCLAACTSAAPGPFLGFHMMGPRPPSQPYRQFW